MKKILLLPIFVSFFCDIGTADALTPCNSIIKDNYAHDANGNLTADGRAEMETDCKQNGCFFGLGVCRFCSTDTYGSGGSCHSCGDLTFRQNYKGYWNHSDKYKTQLSGSCYAKCSEKDPGAAKANSTWHLSSANIVNYPDKCTWEVYCNTGYYRTGTSNSDYACNACASLAPRGYWTGGAGGANGNTACVATCGSGKAKLPGATEYMKATVNYPDICEAKSCKNSDNYCSDNNSTPNGYHQGVTGRAPNLHSVCNPNWKKYTSGDDTGFQYWDISKSPADWSTGYITTCGAGHLNPKTVKTTPNCDKQYGTCESDIQKCDENFLGNCYVYYTSANMTSQIAVHGSISTTGQLAWAGDNTTDKWTVSSGECKCRVDNVPIIECEGAPARNCKEIGKKQVELSYTGNGRKGASNDTLWGNAETTVTSCVAGYYANKDHTACIPVEDGYYSPLDSLKRMDCKEDPYSGNKDNYYTHSDGARSDASNCYVNCSERADYLNDEGRDSLKGEWRWEGGPIDKRYAGSLNFPCDEYLQLYCNGDYYGYGTGENRKCDLCSNLTDSIGQPGYWNKSDGGPGGQTQCYAQCSDKMPSATNGEFTADESMVYYNAITKAKCEYTLVCNEGYYRKNDGKKCNPCPAGSTSDKGADAITQCYMEGGSEGTEFCDNHGCFNLPTGVKIFYVGN